MDSSRDGVLSMELNSSKVHRNLDVKLKMMGMEVQELVFVLLFASIMNLCFGGTRLSLYLVFVCPSVAALVLILGKRGKPDRFLVHCLRYYLQAGHFVAGSEAKDRDLLKRRIHLKYPQ